MGRNIFGSDKREYQFLNTCNYIKMGKIDLPVSPKCNIQCRYCKKASARDVSENGCDRFVLSPKEAVRFLEKAISSFPDLDTVEITGPGDTLATGHAIDTFNMINEKFPWIKKSISTNGLLLREKAETLIATGIKKVNVNINAVKPEILEKICSSIIYDGNFMEGQKAIRWLLLSQLSGISKIVKLGAEVVVGTMLIPGVNDSHIGDIAKIVSAEGAAYMNIMPANSRCEMATVKAADRVQLETARAEVMKYFT